MISGFHCEMLLLVKESRRQPADQWRKTKYARPAGTPTQHDLGAEEENFTSSDRAVIGAYKLLEKLLR
uniref:HEPN domain-containing protein n=1 Tax=Ascaris lumbricoides TaxID=6252 RepID=A0A0M3I4J5_ASCLU